MASSFLAWEEKRTVLKSQLWESAVSRLGARRILIEASSMLENDASFS